MRFVVSMDGRKSETRSLQQQGVAGASLESCIIVAGGSRVSASAMARFERYSVINGGSDIKFR